jgi:hypothetical protein
LDAVSGEGGIDNDESGWSSRVRRADEIEEVAMPKLRAEDNSRELVISPAAHFATAIGQRSISSNKEDALLE